MSDAKAKAAGGGAGGASLQQPLMAVVASAADDGDLSLPPSQNHSRVSVVSTNPTQLQRPNETTALLLTAGEGEARADPDSLCARLDAWRLSTYIFLNGSSTASKVFQLTLVLLILLNISVFVLSTEPSVAQPNHDLFDTIELVSVLIFTVEYGLRLWTITEAGQKPFAHRVWGRLRYAVSLTALIDFVSVFTFYVGLMINTKLPGLTWIRALRIFRILKTEAYTNAFQSLIGVITLNQEILGVGLAVAAVLLLLTSTFIYYVEKDNDPAQFGSIPKCMYASMLMLTGQGTPNPPADGTDFPIVTKVAICLTAFFSVAIFAIPAAMLAYGFEVEADKVRRWKLTNQKLKAKCQRDGKAFIPLPIDRFQGFESDVEDDDVTSPAPAPVVANSGAGPIGAATVAGVVVSPAAAAAAAAAAGGVSRTGDSDDGGTGGNGNGGGGGGGGGSVVSVSVAPAPGVVAGCLTCPHCHKQVTVSLAAH